MLAVVVGAILLGTTACTAESDVPRSIPTSTPVSERDLDNATLDYLETNAMAFADQLGIVDPPNVQPIRLITLNEWASTQIACLNDAGFDVTESPDGQGIRYPPFTDPALKQSLNLAIFTCEMQYPTQQKYMTPLSTEGLELLYAYRTGELLQCLDDEGYGVTARPPSQTVFIQSDGVWTPYSDLSIAQNDLKRVFAACPQTPDSVYGN
ncbi:hypothetical protein GCM10027056_29940 [Glaciibacter psychrotolerans]